MGFSGTIFAEVIFIYPPLLSQGVQNKSIHKKIVNAETLKVA